MLKLLFAPYETLVGSIQTSGFFFGEIKSAGSEVMYNIFYELDKMNLYSRAIFENVIPSKTAA